jgi:hypothetical protein
LGRMPPWIWCGIEEEATERTEEDFSVSVSSVCSC